MLNGFSQASPRAHSEQGEHSFPPLGMPPQSAFTKTSLRGRIAKNKLAFAACTTLYRGLDDPLLLHCAVRAKQTVADSERSLEVMVKRSREIATLTFNLNAWDDETALRDFRFTVRKIGERISPFVNFNRGRTKRNRYRVDPVFATCVLLRRLSSPLRWKDLTEFYRYPSQLSEIFWEVIEHILLTRFHLITTFRTDLIQSHGTRYAEAIAGVAPLDKCIGFLDCTFVRVCRPKGRNALQRLLYNGHKRAHGIKFQSLTTPDGLCFHVFGPTEGRRHDTTLYRNSNMGQILQEWLFLGSQQHCVYADAAYVLRPWRQIGYGRLIATSPEMQEYDKQTSAARVSVEWTYKDVRQHWSMLDFRRKLKLKEAPLGLCWIVACLFWNLKVVLGHDSQAQTFFDCPPPSWSEYDSLPVPEEGNSV